MTVCEVTKSTVVFYMDGKCFGYLCRIGELVTAVSPSFECHYS